MMSAMMAEQNFNVLHAPKPRRDAYGFALRPQHVQRYREYSHIYKEEEEERSNKWKNFLEHVEKSSELFSPEKAHKEELQAEATERKAETVPESGEEGNDTSSGKSVSGCSSERDPEKELQHSKETKKSKVQTWTLIRSSLGSIENMMSFRIRKGKIMKDKQIIVDKDHLPSEAASLGGASEDDVEEDVCFSDALNDSPDAFTAENSVSDGFSDSVKVAGEVEAMDGGVPHSVQSIGTEEAVANGVPPEPFFPWKLELESLVWQAFVGVKARRVERYYYELLAQETNTTESVDKDNSSGVPRKWRRQIEKDIPRTFPGHPALNEDGRNSLRRLLLAYARHNPSVGYCQAMNFFAGTLVGIIDEYFDGYYTEEMIESQVDQLVFEELVRENFPKLVIRVWDVLLFEGNRVMLFRTALALLELYGPALVTTKDAGDAITLLQSLVGTTFDSSQLVLTACMGFLAITETRLQDLRDKHRPAVLAVVEERSKMGQVWKDSKGLASKLYSFKHDPIVTEEKNTTEEGTTDGYVSHSKSGSRNLDELLSGTSVDSEVDSLPELQDQVIWLKVELCRMLEEKRSAVLRAEELETALMEIVKLDNRRELSARVEQLEKEVAELQQALADKTEQEAAMLKVLMWMEQEQKVTEDARISAEQEGAVQKNAVHVLQEKYDKAMSSLTEMEKRVKVAESMLEATLQYESGQAKALKSPRAATTQGNTKKLGILSFGLGWRDRNKGASDLKSPSEQREPSSPKDKTGEEEKGHAK
ncbi:Ypt/Rab-GAP domain of gyp1p superfamily protein [Prunus dulcis]|uniref:Ypt/Rab-GAP domain of gyp1p superfamily protein n=1 Tax=Prunus dulcis TaxID=3755 RepID=A0A4Y1RNZ1_PRUDU|nr:Ypt/Rab-GAP domain of gyp1p superfamily protein [Prunus dulcis]